MDIALSHTLPRCGTDSFATWSRKPFSRKQESDHLIPELFRKLYAVEMSNLSIVVSVT